MDFEIIEGHWSKSCSKAINCSCATYFVICKQNSNLNFMFNKLEEAEGYVIEQRGIMTEGDLIRD